MTLRLAALCRAAGVIRERWLLIASATVVVAALVAPAAVGIGQRERADARAELAAFASALTAAQAEKPGEPSSVSRRPESVVTRRLTPLGSPTALSFSSSSLPCGPIRWIGNSEAHVAS